MTQKTSNQKNIIYAVHMLLSFCMIIGSISLPVSLTIISRPSSTYAANTFEVIPEAKKNDTELGQDVDDIAGKGTDKQGTVRDRLNKKADGYENEGDVGSMFATGAFTWNGIFLYLIQLIRFISNIGLIVGAIMIIYNGYEYALASFSGKDPGTGRIQKAIQGMLIVIFAYAIIQILKSAFL